MKIIKNIVLLTALSMPFAASAWEWSDVRKKAAATFQSLFEGTGVVGILALMKPTILCFDRDSNMWNAFNYIYQYVLPLHGKEANVNLRPGAIKEIGTFCDATINLAHEMTLARNIGITCLAAAAMFKVGSYLLKPTKTEKNKNTENM